MLWPLAILAALSAVAGYLGHRFHLTAFLERVMPAVGGGEVSPGAELLVTGISIVAALAGLALAWAVYQKGWIDPATVSARWSLLYRVSKHKFYFDEIYSAVIVRPLLVLSRGSLGFDLGAIDGVVNWCGRITERGGFSFSRMQSGKVRDYLLFMSLGMAAVIGVWIWW
jgi:NADH-quinone oxidoreductase subunit L